MITIYEKPMILILIPLAAKTNETWLSLCRGRRIIEEKGWKIQNVNWGMKSELYVVLGDRYLDTKSD